MFHDHLQSLYYIDNVDSTAFKGFFSKSTFS